MKKRLIVLGSTGSIGQKVLEIAADFPGCFEIVALATNRQTDLLAEQAHKFRPKAVSVSDPAGFDAANALSRELGCNAHLGTIGLSELVEQYEADVVVVATVGFVGLKPTIKAIHRGITVALANKEVLVTAGDVIMPMARHRGVRILPIDSEHNAIFQCMNGSGSSRLRRLILTASGGPFRGSTRDAMASITPGEALRHPTWNMGPKITIDSSTLMNKGFEVIEAAHLFSVPVEKVEVVIHPQSTIHSMIEYVDGSILAQLGVTDMYLPIQNVLFYPERFANKFPSLDFAGLSKLTFEKPDLENFPCLAYAYEAARLGGTYPTVLNAANEVAVARFLNGEIPFLRISETIRAALDAHESCSELTLAAIDAADNWTRNKVRDL